MAQQNNMTPLLTSQPPCLTKVYYELYQSLLSDEKKKSNTVKCDTASHTATVKPEAIRTTRSTGALIFIWSGQIRWKAAVSA